MQPNSTTSATKTAESGDKLLFTPEQYLNATLFAPIKHDALSTEEQRIARPLAVLVPLIKDDLQHAREAGMDYYRAAGEKLLEAKSQMKHGEFKSWIDRNFTVRYNQAAEYMALAAHLSSQKSVATDFSTLSALQREVGRRAADYNTFASRKPDWQPEVKEIVERLATQTLNRKRDELDRQQERDAQQALALQLIDIGYKVLARELHPDKGGSRDAMARLNAVRDRLKQSALAHRVTP